MAEHDFVLSIGNPASTRKTGYRGAVNGFVTEHDSSLEGSDSIANQFQFSGGVRGGWDHYAIKGWITELVFDPDNGAQVLIDGESVGLRGARDYRPARFREGGGGGGDFGGGGGGGSSSGSDGPGPSNDTGGSPPPKDQGGSTNRPASWQDAPAQDGGSRDLTPRYGVVNRRAKSKRDQDYRVGHGDFRTGDGSDQHPFGTVQDGLNAVADDIEHVIRVVVSKGTHASEPGNSLNSGTHTVHQTADFRLIGDPATPRDHVIDVNQANFQFDPGTAQNARVEGIHLKGTMQLYSGTVDVRDAVIEQRGGRWGSDAVALDSYGGDYELLGATEIHTSGSAFNLVENNDVGLGSNVTVRCDGPLVTTGQRGGALFVAPGADVESDAGKITSNGFEPAPVRVIDPAGELDHLDPGGHVEGR